MATIGCSAVYRGTSALPQKTDVVAGMSALLLITSALPQHAMLLSRLQWLHAVFATELGQIVVDIRPLSAGVVIVVRLRITVDLAVERGKRNIEDFWLSLTEDLAATGAAEAARAMFRTLIGGDMLFALSDFETLWRDAGPGHEARAMRSAAHGAVAMAAERGR